MILNISIVDILFVVTVALMVFNGIRNGAIFSLINLISIPIGWFAAYTYGPEFTAILASDNAPATPLIAMLAIFFGVVFIFHIVGTLIRGAVQKIPGVGFGDALLGGFIGLFEAWLLWLLLLIVLSGFLADAQRGALRVSPQQLRAWHDFYNAAISESLFARLNAFFVHTLPTLTQTWHPRLRFIRGSLTMGMRGITME